MNFNWPLIGHKNIIKFLQKSIEQGKISHAYLFYGPENLGKKTVAKYFALSLICQREKKPCLECENCKGFLKDIYPDAVWIRKKEIEENETDEANEGKERGRKKKIKNISIDQIRDLKEKISLAGFTNTYKIIIIVNAEEMTNEAANSFLKILEEPPPKSVIILLANELKNIPETIISRCQLLKFSPISKNEIFEHLEKEQKLKKKEAEEIASLALGHPGRALGFIENRNLLENYKETQKKLIEIIGSDLNKRLKISEEIVKEDEIYKIINNWKILARDLVLLKNNNQALVVNLFLKNQLEEIAKSFSFKKIYQLEKELENLRLYLNQNVNLRLMLDNFVINL